ncbi:hypothetical protein BJ138DRAFT_1146963 [Hygrophoropsis aurantiaca]|uniref:Uncharacterized protein n=1 Tax=Hygrophoropsis aurantiaca TaxID=72124 RepID=A0ACB8AKH3_9AGAM|nr:hypothetical protein BJ138DRAFT_1146963 [Hygrophoropsis aurantiaca]
MIALRQNSPLYIFCLAIVLDFRIVREGDFRSLEVLFTSAPTVFALFAIFVDAYRVLCSSPPYILLSI